MLNYTSKKGLTIELRCQLAFTSLGILVSQPITNDSRYDFIVDIDDKLYKIQCKSSTATDDSEDAFTFSVGNSGEKKSYQGQIDYFFTTFDDTDYLIPIDEVGVRYKTLRLRAKLPESTISWAKDYEFMKVITQDLKYHIPDSVWQDVRDISYLEKYKKNKENKEHKCVDCGSLISRGATKCIECYKKIKKENSIDIDRETLKMKIRTMSFVSIGKEYNVTDNAIRQWCDKYDLPRKKSDIKQFSDEDWKLI